jgi:hypothetical protein
LLIFSFFKLTHHGTKKFSLPGIPVVTGDMHWSEFGNAISTAIVAAILSFSVYAFSKALAARRIIWNIQKAGLVSLSII